MEANNKASIKESEEHIAKNIKVDNDHFFKYIRSRKPRREMFIPFNRKSWKVNWRTGTLTKFFALIFTEDKNWTYSLSISSQK